MSNTSKIEWTDRTWNPITGCTKVSSGCKNCYAETMAKRFWGGRPFNDVRFHDNALKIPYRWKKPSMVFVNSMSDLFHINISFDVIDSIIKVIKNNSNHTFQALTKRPKRMLEWYNTRKPELPKNLWLGVTTENTKTAIKRIPLLLQVPAKIRFLSVEPLLEEIDFYQVSSSWPASNHPWKNAPILSGIDWVIVGGESGIHAREMDINWVRLIRNQCEESNAKFYFKQWGTWREGKKSSKKKNGRDLDGKFYSGVPVVYKKNRAASEIIPHVIVKI